MAVQVNKSRSRLGRGLSSLLSVSEPVEGSATEVAVGEGSAPQAAAQPISPPPGTAILDLPVESIRPNPHQPRRDFNETSLAELAQSLKTTGLIQPIIVRQVDGGHELIAGERRLRAAKLAGLATLPAIVKEVDGFTQAQMALIENIQREDLNAIDRALAYRMLIDQLGLTHGELAGRLGEDRTSVVHFLRLLDLTEPVRELVRSGKLSVGHGKVLAGVTDAKEQERLATVAIEQSLSVRNLERIIEQLPAPKAETAEPAKASNHLKDLEKSLSRQLGMKVQLKWSNETKRGKMVISYTLDQFDDLKQRLGVETD
jgi:ParB family transcriptional regulator, chromosome partitioning protein